MYFNSSKSTLYSKDINLLLNECDESTNKIREEWVGMRWDELIWDEISSKDSNGKGDGYHMQYICKINQRGIRLRRGTGGGPARANTQRTRCSWVRSGLPPAPQQCHSSSRGSENWSWNSIPEQSLSRRARTLHRSYELADSYVQNYTFIRL